MKPRIANLLRTIGISLGVVEGQDAINGDVPSIIASAVAIALYIFGLWKDGSKDP